jgi:cbb3-type cytochrome oxidase subunit 3
MVISSTEAAEALRDIAQTDRRTRVSGAYHVASPHLILWGLIWAAGYAGSGFTPPEKWGLVWLPLILVGVVGAILLGRRGAAMGVGGASGAAGFSVGKSMTLALAIGLFIGSVYFVFQPVSPLPYLVFPALITALIYVLLGGLLGLPRYVAIGAIMFLVTMVGFIYAKPFLPFWIAAAGGGGLVLGGLWMRKV